jgi:aldehyde dehydrogenase (NAD+)
MRECLQFYIDGAWVDPVEAKTIDVLDPATEKVCGRICNGSAKDVDRAVDAAVRAFGTYARSSRETRLALLERIVGEYKKRYEDIAQAITLEMGAPISLSRDAQVAIGLAHFETAIKVLKEFSFDSLRGSTRIVREPVGVCGLITPWNWPMNQMVVKVAPALATGCTMVLKPSEISPFSAIILAEILDAAGVPKGVFNLVNGDGAGVGARLSSHPKIDLVSFTGSTRAGVAVAKAAADTVKRVHQELGGKSANILLPNVDFQKSVTSGVKHVMQNSGQSCNAPTRMLVPHGKMKESIEVARRAAEEVTVGNPQGNFEMGPVASKAQWDKIQGLIGKGIDEGATLVAGGLGRPEGLDSGYYVRPTVFANVTNDMTIAREEIFGPVVSILGYASVNEAVDIANDTDYGLAAFIQGKDVQQIKDVSSRLRAGQININSVPMDMMAPFGGYKQSGNGREWSDFAFFEFLEIKAEVGYGALLETN